jgi:ethanolamine utilization microcompartment shell protein EutL
VPYSTAQALVSRRAFDALDVEAIRQHARSIGIVRAQFEASTHKAPTGMTRLTCSIDLAVVFIESFRRLAAEAERTQDSDLLIRLRGVGEGVV